MDFSNIRLIGGAAIKNARVENLATDPVAPFNGQIWYNTTDNVYKGYDGTNIFSFATGGNAAALQLEVDQVETSLGLGADGTLAPFTGVSYIAGATTLRGAVVTLAGQAQTTADALASEVSRAQGAEGTLTADLATEVSRATSAEGTLTTNLGNEVTRAQGAEATLTSNLASEVTRATAAEGVIAGNLATEVTRAQTAEAGLASSISGETSRATTAESGLNTRLTTVEGAFINKDGSVAFTGDQSLAGHKVTNVGNGVDGGDAVNKSQLDAAIAALGNAFDYVGTLTAGSQATPFDLSTLTTAHAGSYYKNTADGYFTDGTNTFRAFANDGIVKNTTGGWDVLAHADTVVAGTANFVTVTGDINAGFTVDVDSNFKGRVSTLESGLSSEISRATAAEGVLTGDLAAEVSRATGAEGVLTTNLSAEVSRAQGAEATLTSNLASEVTRATTAEGVLTTNLGNEVTRAQGAEATLTTNLAAEVTRATGAEAALAADLASEVTRAQGVEVTLAAADAALTTRYEGGFYEYNGAASATTHNITHGIGTKYVSVTVIDSTDNVVIPDSIVFVDSNNLTVSFATAITCRVVVMGKKVSA